MAPTNPRSRRPGFLFPLALTATAAAVAALWYLYNDDEPSQPHHPPSPSRRTTAAAETSTTPAPTPSTSAGHKPIFALVVSESSTSSPLLSRLPSPLPASHYDVTILIHSPDITSHPLSDSDSDATHTEGRVYRQARRLLGPGVPREMVLPYKDRGCLVPLVKGLGVEGIWIEGRELAMGARESGDGFEVVKCLVEGGKWVGSRGVVVVAGDDEGEVERCREGVRRWGKRAGVLALGDVGDRWLERVG